MPEILLFSAGLDSFPAWHFLGRPPALYFDIRHHFREQELAAVKDLAGRCQMDLTISDELDLSAWDTPQGDLIPFRNVLLAMLAALRADVIWCAGVKGDHTADKSPEAFAAMSEMLTRIRRPAGPGRQPVLGDDQDRHRRLVPEPRAASRGLAGHVLLPDARQPGRALRTLPELPAALDRAGQQRHHRALRRRSLALGTGERLLHARPCGTAPTRRTAPRNSSGHWPPSACPASRTRGDPHAGTVDIAAMGTALPVPPRLPVLLLRDHRGAPGQPPRSTWKAVTPVAGRHQRRRGGRLRLLASRLGCQAGLPRRRGAPGLDAVPAGRGRAQGGRRRGRRVHRRHGPEQARRHRPAPSISASTRCRSR